MKYFLVNFFLLVLVAVSFVELAIQGSDQNGYYDYLNRFRYSLRNVSDSENQIREKDINGSNISTVITCYLPAFSDLIKLEDVRDNTENFNIVYQKVKFFKPSSAYALSHRIDLDANMVQTLLSLGKAQFTGQYAVSKSAPNAANLDFEVNLYANIVFIENTLYTVENGKVILGKTDYHRLVFDKVKSKYANANSFAAALENYVSPKLLEAVSLKLHEEVSQKVSPDTIRQNIEREILFKENKDIAHRLEKAIIDSLEDIHYNDFTLLLLDQTNFSQIIENFHVTIPSFLLRRIEKFVTVGSQASYVANEVRVKVSFLVPSPVAGLTISYRNKNDQQAQDQILNAQYLVGDMIYEFDLAARRNTSTVYLRDVIVKVPSVEVSPAQGLLENELDTIIQRLPAYLISYIKENAQRPTKLYTLGMLAEGRISYKVFHK